MTLNHFRPLKPFSLKELQVVKTEFIRQSLAAAKGKPESLAWFDSLIEPWNKDLKTNRPVLVMDLGGSFLRLGVADSKDGKELSWLMEMRKQRAVNEHLNPVSFINWLIKNSLPLIRKFRVGRVGFIFSYPHQPQQFGKHITGRVSYLNKASVIPGIEGVDIGKLYLNQLKKAGVKSFEKLVVLNDTVALNLCEKGAAAALVIGTGANICTVHPDLKNLRNLEAGNFNCLNHTTASAFIDLLERPGIQNMEKQSAGRYQYRILALAALVADLRGDMAREIMKIGLQTESLIVTEISQGKFRLLKDMSLSVKEKGN